MFESKLLLNPEIIVTTRQGTRIDNAPGALPFAGALLQYRDWCAKHPKWVRRKPPTGGYNCFGHVFASRRTSIYDPKWVDLILREDGYRKISEVEALPDDVVLYRQDDGEVCHAVRVVKADEPILIGSTVPHLLVVSKWSDNGGESIHYLEDCPEELRALRFTTEVWTDR